MTAMTRVLSLSIAALALGSAPRADEGMWLFNQFPAKQVKQRYGFEPNQKWLDHLRLSSVRFNSGGSGSFVSSRGLVMTNHHVGADALQKLSTAERDLIKLGYNAAETGEELKCLDLELNVLLKIQDVTDQVQAAVKPGQSATEAQLARRAVINTIEKEQFEKTGLRSDVVTLFQGGQYHLYQFKKYTDVRLVFAPEKEIAFFGGDPDNFEYPRYDLDICFFRVYENDQPAKIEHFLQWSKAGAADGELVFVSGHPGRTNRLNTVAHLEYLRDVLVPEQLDVLRRHEVLLSTYSNRSLENARRALDDLFSVQNRRKARLGALAGLQDPSILEKKRAEEHELRDKVDNDAKLKKQYGTAWNEIAKTIETVKTVREEFNLLEGGGAFNTDLFQIARTLVRMAEEDQKPNAKRLREFGEAGRASLEQRLFSEAPIYRDLETVKLADSLGMMAERLGFEHQLVKTILDGKSPRERATELLQGSKLDDVAERKRLAASADATAASEDALIVLARTVDPRARELRTIIEQQVEEPQRQAYAKVAAARFAVLGSSTYPDATFTLRLAYGAVRGYKNEGQTIPPWTRMGETFEHARQHGDKEPFALPQSWLKGRENLNSDTPFNFISTCDIIGGNSGSPVVNQAGEVVGIIFDGNLSSLVWDYAYSDDQGRAVSVHSSAIQVALRKIYKAKALGNELGN